MSKAAADALFQSALGQHRSGAVDAARAGYEQVLRLDRNHAEALHHLGIVHLQAGDFRKAAELIGRSVDRAPRQPAALSNLGFALFRLGQHRKAVHACNRALQLVPGSAAALVNRANALAALGEHAKAEADYRAALAIEPKNPEFHFNLANALFARGDFTGAAAAFETAAALAPGTVEIGQNLGATYLKLGRSADALARFDAVLAIEPGLARAHANRANALGQLQRREEAAAAYRKAVTLEPGLAEAWSSLGIVLRDLGRLDEAETACRRVLALDPDHAVATANLGSVLRDLGRPREARELFERALALDPGYVDAHRNILLSLTYDPETTPEAFFAAHRRFEAAHARPVQRPARAPAAVPEPERRLRIGYLSADLRGHSVARNLEPILRHHDRRQFEIRLYGEVAQPDATTARLQAMADGWRSTVGLDDRAVAEAIRADGVDILLCLAGRFDLNRPLVAALRPAPVQASLFDAATSGLAAIDYLFSDRTMTPRGTPERFTERVLCLPHFYVADLPPDLPPVRPRPAGPVTFGCLNNPAKIGAPLLDLWARLLADVPDSRLVLRYLNHYGTPSLRARIEAAFAARGIDAGRLEFPDAAGTFAEHLELYNTIDVALDSFPFSGSTTTFDSLSMGVPVVTLPGWSMMSRWTAAMLAGIGLGDLAAATADDFIAIARGLAADSARRAALRGSLRARLAASPLCDGARKARQIERFYRAIWRRRCAAQR